MNSEMVLQQAKRLLSDGSFDKCVAFIESAQQENESAALHQIRAEALWRLQRYEQSLPSFRITLRELSINAPFTFFQMARTAVGKLGLPAKSAKEFWRACTDPISVDMGQLHQEVLARDDPGDGAAFRNIAARVFSDPHQMEVWAEAFEILRSAVHQSGGPPPGLDQAPEARPKVLVSGMGWSGSGAVYDYLAEFDGVVPVKGETGYLESATGFRNLAQYVDDRERLVKAALAFFFQTLIGYDHMVGASSFKDFRAARLRIGSDQALTYARGCREVVKALSSLLYEIPEGEKSKQQMLSHLADVIVDNLVAFDAPAGKYVLLDNCIHISNIEIAEYLTNATVLCVVRDPRSNYVALKRENKGFADSAEDFIRKQAKTRADLLERVVGARKRLSAGGTTRVELVHFEDFVLSRRTREDISGQLGVTHNPTAKHSRFRPWESIRNALLHEEHDDQDEIEMIRAALPEYCREPVTVPLSETKAAPDGET